MLEVLLWLPLRPLVRRVICFILIPWVSFTAGLLVFQTPTVSSGLLGIIVTFRIINLLRVIENRLPPQHLYPAVRQTSVWLLVALLGVIGLRYFKPLPWSLVTVVAVGQLGMATAIAWLAGRNFVKTRPPRLAPLVDADLPTVSVVIPARNETTDLEACLQSVLASDYPKLEVLVLDDCSQDRTAEIIRSFAHDGVRFIQGKPPGEQWLAKNQAYQQLLEAATGELVLFCGVDVRFDQAAIRQLVSGMLERRKTMVSLLPRRLSGPSLAGIMQPLRYWWELALPRRLFNRPAVLSTCWIVRREAVLKLGGFKAVSHAVIPERFLARAFIKDNNYSFWRASSLLNIQTMKSAEEQQATTIRVRYPQIHRRPEMALGLLLLELIGLLGPFIGLVSSVWRPWSMVHGLFLTSCLLLLLTQAMIVAISNPANLIVAVLTTPIAIATEIVLGIVSMLRYEFSEVDWKGRNICIPVLQSFPRLPKL